MSQREERCGNCKFWGRAGDDPTLPVRSCRLIVSASYEALNQGVEAMIEVPGSAIVGRLVTRAEFGCKLFWPKEGP